MEGGGKPAVRGVRRNKLEMESVKWKKRMEGGEVRKTVKREGNAGRKIA
jgi:hypothetical protein